MWFYPYNWSKELLHHFLFSCSASVLHPLPNTVVDRIPKFQYFISRAHCWLHTVIGDFYARVTVYVRDRWTDITKWESVKHMPGREMIINGAAPVQGHLLPSFTVISEHFRHKSKSFQQFFIVRIVRICHCVCIKSSILFRAIDLSGKTVLRWNNTLLHT